MNKILCFLGFHRWAYNRKLSPIDYFPPSFIKYEPPVRTCLRCGKIQGWLPGYGGSELGCWIKKGKHYV